MKGCPLEETGHGECKYYINYLEMLAVCLGLKTFAKDKAYTHIRICVITPDIDLFASRIDHQLPLVLFPLC